MKLLFLKPRIGLTHQSKPFFNQSTGSLFFGAYFLIFCVMSVINEARSNRLGRGLESSKRK